MDPRENVCSVLRGLQCLEQKISHIVPGERKIWELRQQSLRICIQSFWSLLDICYQKCPSGDWNLFCTLSVLVLSSPIISGFPQAITLAEPWLLPAGWGEVVPEEQGETLLKKGALTMCLGLDLWDHFPSHAASCLFVRCYPQLIINNNNIFYKISLLAGARQIFQATCTQLDLPTRTTSCTGHRRSFLAPAALCIYPLEINIYVHIISNAHELSTPINYFFGIEPRTGGFFVLRNACGMLPRKH